MNLYSDDIAYLKMGSDRQQAAFITVIELDLFSVLADYDPLLTGTLPLGLDLPDTDLDVICQVEDFAEFGMVMRAMYGYYDEFEITGRRGHASRPVRSGTIDFASGSRASPSRRGTGSLPPDDGSGSAAAWPERRAGCRLRSGHETSRAISTGRAPNGRY